MSLLINLLAIPFVTFAIVPMSCVGLIVLVLLPEVGLQILMFTANILHHFMTFLASIPTLTSDVLFPLHVWAGLSFLVVTALFPGIKFKPVWLAVMALAIGLEVYGPIRKASDSWQLHVFDVGQGTALLIQSESKGMLVDTGPSFGRGKGTTLAQSVIAPALDMLNIERPMAGVITHFDHDHAAGMGWLQQQKWVANWRSPEGGCLRGDKWRLDDLTIEVLWPPAEQSLSAAFWSKNNGSCVLLITAGEHSVLIPGDIELKAERTLLAMHPNLRADILIAPHHGSKTSSSKSWVQTVRPRYVVFTTGYLNRWGFPHPEVVGRYREVGAQILSTGVHGYLRFDIPLPDSKEKISVDSWRYDLAPRWYTHAPPNYANDASR